MSLNPAFTPPPLHPACVACLVKKQIDRYPASATRGEILAYMRRLGDMMGSLPDATNGPEIMEAITDIRREVFGDTALEIEGDYAAIKAYFNRYMIRLSEDEGLLDTILASPDPPAGGVGLRHDGELYRFRCHGCGGRGEAP